jgi:CheY-like chemotaxis protein
MAPILLVDDNEDLRELYASVLRNAGYTVHEADNGQAALESLEHMACDPCLVLLDLMMPVMSGPEFLKVLQERNRLAALTVVVLSAGGRPTDAPEARKFIHKPVEPKVLLTVVREFCGSA